MTTTTILFDFQRVLMVASALFIFIRFRGSAFGAFGAMGIGCLVVATVLVRTVAGDQLVASRMVAVAAARGAGYALLLIGLIRYRHAPRPPSERSVSKARFLGTFVAGMLAPVVAMILVALLGLGAQPGEPLSGGAVAVLLIAVLVGPLVSLITLLSLLHRMWSALEGLDRRMSPALAVWGHFIPVLYIYFTFQAWSGWALDYNRAAAKASTNIPRIPVLLPVAIYVLWTAFEIWVLLLGAQSAARDVAGAGWSMLGIMLVAGVVGSIAVFVSVACDGLNALAQDAPTAAVQ